MDRELEQQVLSFADAMLSHQPSLLQRFRADFNLGGLGGFINTRIPEMQEVEAARFTQLTLASGIYAPEIGERQLNAAIERAIKKWADRQPAPYLPAPITTKAKPSPPQSAAVQAPLKLRSIVSIAQEESTSPDWHATARKFADEAWIGRIKGTNPSKAQISKRVAKRFGEEGIFGPRGPLSETTILREALTKWNKPSGK